MCHTYPCISHANFQIQIFMNKGFSVVASWCYSQSFYKRCDLEKCLLLIAIWKHLCVKRTTIGKKLLLLA